MQAITGGRPEQVDHRAQAEVVRPEVVAPLAQAVGLVDHEEGDLPGQEGGPQRRG